MIKGNGRKKDSNTGIHHDNYGPCQRSAWVLNFAFEIPCIYSQYSCFHFFTFASYLTQRRLLPVTFINLVAAISCCWSLDNRRPAGWESQQYLLGCSSFRYLALNQGETLYTSKYITEAPRGTNLQGRMLGVNVVPNFEVTRIILPAIQLTQEQRRAGGNEHRYITLQDRCAGQHRFP